MTAPPDPQATRTRRLPVAVVGAVAVLLLSGCGGASTSVSCRGADCRATVTGAPVEVSQPDPNQPTRSGRTTTRRPPRSNDGVDFTVTTIGPGHVDVEDDGIVSRVPQGGTFTEDGSVVRLESSDGRTAVLTFRSR